MDEAAISNHAGFIWSVADLLRGDYKQSEYGKVILPFTVLPQSTALSLLYDRSRSTLGFCDTFSLAILSKSACAS
jgi:hypothetical protein